MEGTRIILKNLSYSGQSAMPILPGEPVFDPVSMRLGIGIGGYKPVWYPKATFDGNMQFDDGQGLTNADGSYELKFTPTGVTWNVGGQPVISTLGSDGIAVQQATMLRNNAGADVVIVGYGHYKALVTMLFRIKALLRKIVAGTATNSDVNALFTQDITLDLTNLDPAFPEGPSL